jgi:4-hydroxybenzoate polyprenyltransferase and related prenyltransferases
MERKTALSMAASECCEAGEKARENPSVDERAPPLVVDVDGTLLRTDLLYESVILLLRRRPWCVFLLPFWLLAGKAVMKREIARRVQPDIASLPMHEGLLAWLKGERARGRTLALISASDEELVRRIADRCDGLFDVVAGSDGSTNLASSAKLAAIQRLFGDRFTYAGDGKHDVVIWERCRSAVLVGRTAKLRSLLSPSVEVASSFDVPRAGLRTWLRALRLHQWAKNTLLFVPLLLSGRIASPHDVGLALLAFVVFGLLASGSYLFNDLLDLAADRQHRSKRNRPLASGELPVLHGLMAIPAIAAVVGVLLLLLPSAFAAVAGTYLAITLAYSLWLKRKAILDMLVLALLFTLRIIAGIAAVGTTMSPWLLAFSMFFFLSLACIKRYSECRAMKDQGGKEGGKAIPGRGYRADDAPWLMSMGAASGFCSTLIFFIFLTDAQSPMRHYSTPEWLWLICGILGYWLGRAWLLAGRGEMNDDPVLFAIKDRLSLFLGALCAVSVLLANFL